MDLSTVKESGLSLRTTQLQTLTRGATYSTKRMDSALLNGNLATPIKGILSKTCERATARCLGMKAQFTLAIGVLIFKMAMENLYFPMNLSRREYSKITCW